MSKGLTLTASIVNIVSILSWVLVPFLYGRSSTYVAVHVNIKLFCVCYTWITCSKCVLFIFNFASIVYFQTAFLVCVWTFICVRFSKLTVDSHSIYLCVTPNNICPYSIFSKEEERRKNWCRILYGMLIAQSRLLKTFYFIY